MSRYPRVLLLPRRVPPMRVPARSKERGWGFNGRETDDSGGSQLSDPEGEEGHMVDGRDNRWRNRGTWASRTQNHSEAGYGWPVDRGTWTANTVKRPRQQPAHPQYANYWAPLTRKRHILPHPAQPRHTNYWAPQTRKRHQQEQRPQRPTERNDLTQHAKGRTGECPGPRKETTTRRNVTQGGGIMAVRPMTQGGHNCLIRKGGKSYGPL